MAVCFTAAITLIFSQKLLGITNLQQETLDNPDNEFIEVDVPYPIEQENDANTKQDSFGSRTKDQYLEIESPENLERELNQIPGVVTVGLFCKLKPFSCLVGYNEEVSEIFKNDVTNV